MSMSRKIFCIIGLLVLLAIFITGLAFYSIVQLADQSAQVGKLSIRSDALNTANAIGLQRVIATNEIVAETDEAKIEALIKNALVPTNDAIQVEFRRFRDNLPPNAARSLFDNIAEVESLWANYVKITEEAANLSLRNTNVKAMRLFIGSNDFWDDLGHALNELAALLTDLNEPELALAAQESARLRAELLVFRLNVMQYIPEINPAETARLQEVITTAFRSISSRIAKLAADLPPDKGGRKAADILANLSDTGRKTFEQVLAFVSEDTNVKAATLMRGDGAKAQDAIVSVMRQMLNRNSEETNSRIIEADNLATSTEIVMAVASILGIIISVVLAYITISRITRGLAKIIDGLGESSTQVNVAAAQISDASQSLAEGSTEQAASLEETSSALEEMASMTRQNADNATKTNETTQHNNKLINTGATAVGNMSKAMSEIDDSAEQISRIIKTIEDIAFQTNLLALNAAVEAARAGEAGKGFAVVADEVRNLAQRSAQAARDTTQLIQTTIERVRNGSEIANVLDSSFKEIEEGSQSVSRLISEITAATNEQAQGVDQVNTAVAQMDKVTQQNAASAEESASAAEELSAQAGSLDSMVQDLVAMVEGKARKPAAPQPPRQNGRKVMRVNKVESARPAAAAAPRSNVKMLSASEVIPLGEDDDF